MKTKIQIILTALVAIMFGVTSCNKPEPQKPVRKDLRIHPESIDLEVGEQVQLVLFSGKGEVKAVWSATPQELVSIDEKGLLSALKEGKGTITADYNGTKVTRDFIIRASTKYNLSIKPGNVQLQIGDKIQLELYNGVAPVREGVTWSVDNTQAASIDKDGLFVAIAEGSGVVSATYENQVVTCNFITSKEAPEKFMLPILRMFDDKEDIIALEQGRGSTILTDDPDMGIITFQTTNELCPYISYNLGISIQVFIKNDDGSVLETKEFYEFMEKHGFNTTREVTNVPGYYDYVSFTSDKYKVLNVMTVTKSENEAILPGIMFTVNSKWQPLDIVPMPLLNWNATRDDIKAYEEARGYTYWGERDRPKDHKEVIWRTGENKLEYYEAHMGMYLYDKNNKLVKVVERMAPAQFVFMPAGDGYNIMAYFDKMAKSEGYKTRQSNDGAPNRPKRAVYYNEAKKIKFSIEYTNMKLSGRKVITAGLAFVPYDGPDIVDIEE